MILPGAAALLAPAMQLSLLLASNGPNFMDCRAAPLCGVVTLETGLGGGKYQHDQPVVHGLWPQVGKYGSSSCTAPSSSAAKPTALATCYAPTAPSAEAALAFERYEWGKHGVCAGTVDAADYLDQLCSLAAAPLAEMSRARRAGLGLDDTAAALRQARPRSSTHTLRTAHVLVYTYMPRSSHRRASRCGRSTRATRSWSSRHAQAPTAGPDPDPNPHPNPDPNPDPHPDPNPDPNPNRDRDADADADPAPEPNPSKQAPTAGGS